MIAGKTIVRARAAATCAADGEAGLGFAHSRFVLANRGLCRVQRESRLARSFRGNGVRLGIVAGPVRTEHIGVSRQYAEGAVLLQGLFFRYGWLYGSPAAATEHPLGRGDSALGGNRYAR